jgi:hypothetical protein
MPQVSLQIVVGSILGRSFQDIPDSLTLIDYCTKIGFIFDY